MSLDVSLYVYVDTGGEKPERVELFDSNITHNLGNMAAKGGFYYHVWQPEELGIKFAGEIVETLRSGIARLRKYPEYFKQFSAVNGWGTYEQFLPWLDEYLKICIKHPKSQIDVSR